MAVCAHCGEVFRDSRLACPHCGADADLTWSPDDTPEEFFEHEAPHLGDAEYEDFLRGEGLAEDDEADRTPARKGTCGVAALAVIVGVTVAFLL